MLLSKVEFNIRSYGLLHQEKPVIVGVSGGADSMALLVALVELGYECVAVHANYHLRGEESNRDMRHTQEVCARLGVDLYVRDFDVDARRRATGESVEMACRELRYAWMHDLLDRRRAQAIAVAHHREDNIETFLLNLLRGSSIAGLTGMRWRNGYVVRPLLDSTRAEIEEFLASRSVSYVVDSTNAECEYARNRLRNIVLPLLEEQFPGAGRGILESLRLLGENREFYDHAIGQCRDRYLRDGAIDLQQLISEQPQAPLVLYEIIKGLGFNMTHARNILASARGSGLHFSAGSTTLELDRGILSVRAAGEAAPVQHAYEVSLTRDVLEPVRILVQSRPVTDFRPDRDPQLAFFDEAMLEGNPLFTIRHWQRGDRMQPFGMRGSKLLSDIFAQARLSAAAKRDAWLLLRNGEIIWAIGIRQSALFSLTPDTRRYLVLRRVESRE